MVVRQVAVHARACGVAAGRNGGQRGGSWRRKAGEGQVYDDAIYCLRSVWDLWFRLFYFLDT